MSNAVKSQSLQLPPGRFVNGSLHELQTKDLDGRPVPADEQAYSWGVAVKKDAPGMNELLTFIQQFAASQYVNNPPIVELINKWDFANFSWKLADGDQPSKKTQKVNENTVGCWVFYFRRSNKIGPVQCVQFNGTSNVDVDPALIKRGYDVDMSFKIQINEEQQVGRCGIYVNADIVRFLAVNDVITGGPDADQVMSAPTTAVAPMLGSTTAAPAVGLPGATAPGGLPGAPAPAPAPAAGGLPGAPAPAAVPPHDTFATPGATAPTGLPTGLPGQT